MSDGLKPTILDVKVSQSVFEVNIPLFVVSANIY